MNPSRFASARGSTASALASQWTNPSDIMTVSMVIGGDVVQKALAQATGCWYTPVCFSFGWAAYSFSALTNVLGAGRLLPVPDVECRVINLDSGYARNNKNWVIGRLIRDIAARLEREHPLDRESIRISVWEALDNPNKPTEYRYWAIHIWGLFFMIVQLVIAAVPTLFGDWSVLLVTGTGTLLSLSTGALPQWTAEKLPNDQHSQANFALTAGNGAKDVMVILGSGKCLNLEKLSVSETPRTARPWKKFIKPGNHLSTNWARPFMLRRNSSELAALGVRGGLPIGFQITYFICVVQAILWLGLLITVSGLQLHTWYLLAVGLIGMFQNAFLAAMEIKPEKLNIPLQLQDTIIGSRKVMDGIMDLQATWGCGEHLVAEFFPGSLRPAEKEWWAGNKTAYEEERRKNALTRGIPRYESCNPKLASKFRTVESMCSVASSNADNPEVTQTRESYGLSFELFNQSKETQTSCGGITTPG